MGRTRRRRQKESEQAGLLVEPDKLELMQHAAALCCTFLQDPDYLKITVLGHTTMASEPDTEFARIKMDGAYHAYEFRLQYFFVAQDALKQYASSHENGYEPRHRAEID